MGWLTGATATNKVIDSEENILYGYSLPSAAGDATPGPAYKRVDNIVQYRYTGMTLAAAQVAVTNLNNPPAVVASLRRSNEGGGYEVHIAEIEEGDWEEIV